MSQKIYLTKKGLEKVENELQDLKKILLATAKGKTLKVLHHKELNPDYLALQEDLGSLEARIAELEHIFKNAELIKMPHSREDQNVVNIGATVTLENPEGKINEFAIVGTMEANPKEGKISFESPVGKALLNHKVSDSIQIDSPARIYYKIRKIRYQF